MLMGLMQAPLEVSSRLCEVDISLRDVMRLKPGQIIQADVPPQCYRQSCRRALL
ncbi:FliM/FliN family flagellar motor switch protein [Endozoicomonas sp. GU-1]